MLRNLTVAAAAAALAFAPPAAAQQAAPVEIAPAAETADGDQIRGGFILPLLFIVAIVAAVVLLTGEDEPDPISP